MFTKKCPYCDGSSYSASDTGRWKCPYCGQDLALVPARPAGAREEMCGREGPTGGVADSKAAGTRVESKTGAEVVNFSVRKKDKLFY